MDWNDAWEAAGEALTNDQKTIFELSFRLAQLEAEVERLLKIEKICQRLFEKKDHVAKYIKVEGEGDTWHIPEAIGLALLEALEG